MIRRHFRNTRGPFSTHVNVVHVRMLLRLTRPYTIRIRRLSNPILQRPFSSVRRHLMTNNHIIFLRNIPRVDSALFRGIMRNFPKQEFARQNFRCTLRKMKRPLPLRVRRFIFRHHRFKASSNIRIQNRQVPFTRLLLHNIPPFHQAKRSHTFMSTFTIMTSPCRSKIFTTNRNLQFMGSHHSNHLKSFRIFPICTVICGVDIRRLEGNHSGFVLCQQVPNYAPMLFK